MLCSLEPCCVLYDVLKDLAVSAITSHAGVRYIGVTMVRADPQSDVYSGGTSDIFCSQSSWSEVSAPIHPGSLFPIAHATRPLAYYHATCGLQEQQIQSD
jgi:hypothetical protein